MIRPAILSDVPRLVQLGREFFAEAAWADVTEWDDEEAKKALENLVQMENCLMLVADTGTIVGMAAALIFPIWFNPKILMAQEWFWYVVPSSRNGTGIRLLISLENAIKNRGVKIIEMLSVEELPSLDAIYSKLGYRPAEKTVIKRFS